MSNHLPGPDGFAGLSSFTGFPEPAAHFAETTAIQSNFHNYPLLRATDDPIVGIGEEAPGWVAPSVRNAIFAITGKRIRSLPLKNHNLSVGAA